MPKKGKKSKDVNVEEELNEEREDIEVDEADLVHKQNEEADSCSCFI